MDSQAQPKGRRPSNTVPDLVHIPPVSLRGGRHGRVRTLGLLNTQLAAQGADRREHRPEDARRLLSPAENDLRHQRPRIV